MAPQVEPLEIQVVALDWKWLFLYPQEGVASVNEVAVPVDRPVRFRITSSSVMNTFYVPALAGMIYGMPGMESHLNAVINAPGEYEGFRRTTAAPGSRTCASPSTVCPIPIIKPGSTACARAMPR